MFFDNNSKNIDFKPYISTKDVHKLIVSGHFEHHVSFVGAMVLEI